MHTVYLLARIYPYWAIPVGVIFWQVGVHFMHRRSNLRYSFWAVAGTFFLTSLAWVGFRGDKYAEEWVRTLFMG